MDDRTNPTARLRVNQSPTFPRSLNSGIAMRNIRESASHDFTDDLVVNAWSGTMTQPHTWFGDINLTGILTIAEGATLTILPGTVVKVSQGAMIYCYGTIDARGTAAEPIVFERADSSGEWLGLRIESDHPDNHLSQVTVRGAYNGVTVGWGGTATLDTLTVEQCRNGVVFVRTAGAIRHSTLRHNQWRGLYAYRSNVLAEDNQIYGNDVFGARVWGCNWTRFERNFIYNNGDAHDTTFAYWPGLEILEGAATLHCNKLHHNAGPGVLIMPTGLAQMGYGAGRNQLLDNMQAMPLLPQDYGQIYQYAGSLNLGCGQNTLSDSLDANWLVRGYVEMGWNAEWNDWGTPDTANIRARLVGEADFNPYLTAVRECDDPSEPSACVQGEEDEVFYAAWDLEQAAQFAEAAEAYEAYLAEYKQGKHVAAATDRLLFCQKAAGWAWSDIRDYFIELAADTSIDSSLSAMYKGNAAWCLIEMDQWSSGYNELVALMDPSLKDYAKLALQLRKLLSELSADDAEFLALHPELSTQMGRGACTVDAATVSFETKLACVDEQVEALLKGLGGSGAAPQPVPAPVVPSQYALYQNYPNPFNPVTEIRFDLPEAVHVELTIYNSLGQQVATLVDEPRMAGQHRMTWDASHCASGLYICQLKAGSFVDAKKLVLMK